MNMDENLKYNREDPKLLLVEYPTLHNSFDYIRVKVIPLLNLKSKPLTTN